jgi:hypothetical protein
MTAASPIILHHFDQSPFSEKVRIVFGLKNIAWTSVHISRIMPRPDLMPLTGGYRRTPVMQIGADIYCAPSVSFASWNGVSRNRRCSQRDMKASAGPRRCGPTGRSFRTQ